MESELAAVVEFIAEGLIYLEPSGRIKGWNQAAEEIFGLSKAQALGLDFSGHDWGLLYPDGSPCPADGHPALMTLQDGQPLNDQVRGLPRPAGGVTWLAINTRPVSQPAEGRPRGVVVSFRVVSAAKQAEEALRHSEEKFRLIFQASPDAISLTRLRDAVFVDVNQAFTAITGHSRQEVIGKTYLEIGLWADPSDRQALMLALESQGQVVNWEVKLREKGGRVGVALLSAYLCSLYGEPHILAIAKVITNLKAAQEALRHSEEKFRLVFNSSPEAVFLATPDGAILGVNPEACRIFGYSQEEILSTGRQTLMDASDPRMAALLAERAQTGQARGECTGLRKDGTAFPAEVSSRIYRDASGDILSCVMIRDISRRKQAEEDRASMEAQLRQSQKMQAVGTLAGGIAHEFNNLLATIMGFGELLQDACLGKPEILDDLGQILRACQRGRDLVRQLSAFSQQVEPELRPLDLNREISHTRKMLAQLLPRNVAIQTNLAPGLPIVGMAASHLNQVLINLANNAVQAMPRGGQIDISTQKVNLEAYVCEVCGEPFAGPYVLVSVADNGQGMDLETVQRIFEPFFTTKGVGSGTGLGLSVVQGIIKSYGGHILCQSAADSGTRFNIYLPAYSLPETPGPRPETGAPAKPAGRETILLVDDEPLLLELGRRVLRDAGHTVLTAVDGQESLRIYAQHPQGIDLVILDMGMPGMGGQQCLQDLLAQHPRAKVLVASGYASDSQCRQALAWGARAFVAKPFRKAELLGAIRQVLTQA